MSKLHENLLDLIVIGFALIALLTLFLYGIYNKFVYDKKLSIILLSIYGTFLIFSTVIAIYQAFLE